mmetsp:Transcript_16491/g.37778  ORF Transcript_16491/g.37778 Transcript_16491/m.37778 type:complete len:222 (+) Transcript_16491:313-978(+)
MRTCESRRERQRCRRRPARPCPRPPRRPGRARARGAALDARGGHRPSTTTMAASSTGGSDSRAASAPRRAWRRGLSPSTTVRTSGAERRHRSSLTAYGSTPRSDSTRDASGTRPRRRCSWSPRTAHSPKRSRAATALRIRAGWRRPRPRFEARNGSSQCPAATSSLRRACPTTATSSELWARWRPPAAPSPYASTSRSARPASRNACSSRLYRCCRSCSCR